MKQRFWEDIEEGERLSPQAFPLTVYRLVMAAGATRDFNAIHHNSELARAAGAPDMFANTLFLQGMWEKVAREFFGEAGRIRSLTGFRMRAFNTAGDTVVVTSFVKRKWREEGFGFVELEMQSCNSCGLSVGPGAVTGTLPCRTRA